MILKYEHKEETHNLKSPEIIAPMLYDLFKPESVIDIGCGVGTFLYAFKKIGVNEVVGLDGPWVNKELLDKYLRPDEFKAADLSVVTNFSRKFDLAICLEVAEHIAEVYADNLVKTLVNASDVIIFSAALPYQQGQHHINEQWPEYWENKFLPYNFYFHDLLRPALWNNANVDFWYKQNMFLVIHKDVLLDEIRVKKLRQNTFKNIIHPEAFIKRSKLLNEITEGKKSTYFYIRLLIKKFLNSIGMYKKSEKYT